MKTKYFFTALFFWCTLIVLSQNSLLKSGPMLGYSDYNEVLIWIQTHEAAEVVISYSDSKGNTNKTLPFSTTKSEDFIAKIFPGPLEYGEKYTYDIFINDQKLDFEYSLEFEALQLWQYRMDPPDFSFALGSCFYANDEKDDRPGKPYGSGYKIFNSILEKDPNFMVWIGDNVYLRVPDFLTETGLEYRYAHARQVEALQPLLASVHHYAIWDDHDYGPNNADKSYANKKITERLFNNYWGNLNTNVVGNGGITSHFLWNDVEFFLLDNRYHRDSNDLMASDKSYFGKAQIDWLINALATSRASFKVVVSGGQIVSDAAKFENYATYPKEREFLLQQLNENKIEGVLFITGDRHHTEISRMERQGAYPLIDITCSPLTSGTYSPRDEGNSYLVKDKTFYDHNFGIIEVTGKRKQRNLKLTIYNSEGNKVWDYSIDAKELRY
jgi:alkaline phosphatase D